MLKIVFWLLVVLLLGFGALYLVGHFVSRAGFTPGPGDRSRPGIPTIEVCTTDTKECPDGTFVRRDNGHGCEFFACRDVKDSATPVACTLDARICQDGSGVGRDGERACAWDPCPDEGTVTGTVTLQPTCPYERVFDKPCPSDPYDGDLHLAPVAGGVVTVVPVVDGKFYATLPAGTYEISSGRVLPQCDERFTVVAGADTVTSTVCDSGIR